MNDALIHPSKADFAFHLSRYKGALYRDWVPDLLKIQDCPVSDRRVLDAAKQAASRLKRFNYNPVDAELTPEEFNIMVLIMAFHTLKEVHGQALPDYVIEGAVLCPG